MPAFTNPWRLAILAPLILAACLLPAAGQAAEGYSRELQAGLAAYDRHQFARAREVLAPLAEHGVPAAQLTLGKMYLRGEGVLQDFVAAHRWLNLAASGGSRNAGRLRDEVARRMTPAQLAEAQAQARAFAPSSAPVPPGGVRPESGSPPRDLTTRIQSMLSRLGYDPGPADGVAGHKTRDAIERYQLHSGLVADGRVSQQVHDALAADLGYPTGSPRGPDRPDSAATAPGGERPPARAALSEVLGELRGLVDQGTRNASASPSFLAQLRALAQRYGAPAPQQPRVVVADDFRDGELEHDPRWLVRSGRFWVDAQGRLRSEVRPPPSREATAEDLPLAILGAILGQAGAPGQGGGQAPSPAALIELPAAIPARFTLELERAAGVPAERGMAQALQASLLGDGAASYHLTVRTERDTRVELVRERDSRRILLAQATVPGALPAAAVRWSAADGSMQVWLGGRAVLEVRETPDSGFRSLMLANLLGSVAFDSVTVRTP